MTVVDGDFFHTLGSIVSKIFQPLFFRARDLSQGREQGPVRTYPKITQRAIYL